MLARLQQMLVISWIAALVAAAVLPWRAGHPWGSVLAVTLVVCSHAFWLLVTFSLMRWHNRRDGAPAASWRQWWAAWWGEVRSAPQVFGWRQPFASNVEPDFIPADARGRAGVVLVHGFVCNRGLWTPWLTQLRARGVPFVAVNLEPVFGSIDDYPDLIEAAVAKLEAATGERPLLVGHSMGGLAIRAWLARYGADARVRSVITIGSPHHGTWLATMSQLGLNTREMRPGSPWLKTLALAEPDSRHQLFLCIYGHGDNIVFPASNALLPGARQLHIEGTAHIDLLHHPQALAALWEALDWKPLGRDARFGPGAPPQP